MEEIEERAEHLLARVPAWIWDGETLPVPVEDVADSCLGLYVRDVDDMTTAPGAPALAEGQSLSGLLLPGLGKIWVNASESRKWPARRRFTISHELGHWCMHRSDGGAVYCRKAAIAEGDDAEKAPSARPPEEDEANEFAAALLMPARLMREQYERCRKDFATLCERFDVSGAAMGRRLHAVI